MRNRFLEIYDKNNNPVYEGDFGILDIQSISKRNSEIGKFLAANKPEDIVGEIEFNNSYPEVRTSITLKFKRTNGEYLTFQDYYNYYSDEDPEDQDLNEIYSVTNFDRMFVTYLLRNTTLELQNVEKREKPILEDELFLYFNDEKYSFDEVILIKRNDEVDEIFDNRIPQIIKGDFSHIGVEIKKIHGFNTLLTFFFSDKNGKRSCYRKGRNIKTEFVQLHESLREEYDDLEDKYDALSADEVNKLRELNLPREEFLEKRKEIKEKFQNEFLKESEEIREKLKNQDMYEPELIENIIMSLSHNGDLAALKKLSSISEVSRIEPVDTPEELFELMAKCENTYRVFSPDEYPEYGDLVIIGPTMREYNFANNVGYTVQVRVKQGFMGSNSYLIRKPDGVLEQHENQFLTIIKDDELKKKVFKVFAQLPHEEGGDTEYTTHEDRTPRIGYVV